MFAWDRYDMQALFEAMKEKGADIVGFVRE